MIPHAEVSLTIKVKQEEDGTLKLSADIIRTPGDTPTLLSRRSSPDLLSAKEMERWGKDIFGVIYIILKAQFKSSHGKE